MWVPMELAVSRQTAHNLTVNHQKRLFLTVNRQRCGVILTVKTFQGISNLLISADLNWIKTGAGPQKHSFWTLQHLIVFLYLKYFEKNNNNRKPSKLIPHWDPLVSQGNITQDDLQRRFLAQHSVITLLRHCFERLQHCSNVWTLCCTKNRRYESSRLTSPFKSVVANNRSASVLRKVPQCNSTEHQPRCANGTKKLQPRNYFCTFYLFELKLCRMVELCIPFFGKRFGKTNK